eukprot:2334516-Alexandrium_andersonii.AAC.1
MELDTSAFIEDWVTKDWLVDFYKSEKVATAIISGKGSDQCRPHPEAPDCIEARQCPGGFMIRAPKKVCFDWFHVGLSVL